MRLSEEQFSEIQARLTGAPCRPLPSGNSKGSKYKNVPTPLDGRVFSSKREAKRYVELTQMKAAGEIRGFACQVSIPLPSGKRRMVLDFMITELSGAIRWEDAKGMVHPTWATKRDELEHALGIKVECV